MADEAIKTEVAAATPEAENQDELNVILDALGKDETVAEPKKETPAPSNEDADKQPFKKIGDQVFKTEADYDAWALKNNGDVRRLTGELAAAKAAAAKDPSPQTTADVNAIRMQIKVADFFEANPDAVSHKGVIAALLRDGKAKSLDEAYSKAKRVIDDDQVKDGGGNDVKNILKSGGGESGSGASSYSSKEDVQGTSDFADSALTGKI